MLRRTVLCRNLWILNRPRSSSATGQAAISLAPILTDFALECELRSHWSRFLPELREYTRSFIPTTNMAAHLSVILQAKFVKQRMNLTPLLPITSANCQKPSFMKAWWPKLNQSTSQSRWRFDQVHRFEQRNECLRNDTALGLILNRAMCLLFYHICRFISGKRFFK